jgi:hypothetical protein
MDSELVQYAASHSGVETHTLVAFEETVARFGDEEEACVRGLPIPIVREIACQVAECDTAQDRVWILTRLMQRLEDVRAAALLGSIEPAALF